MSRRKQRLESHIWKSDRPAFKAKLCPVNVPGPHLFSSANGCNTHFLESPCNKHLLWLFTKT